MSDLLNTLGKKKEVPAAAKVADSSATPGESIIGGESPSDSMKRGENLLARTAGTGNAETTQQTNAEEVQEHVDPKTVKNPDDWSKDSALKEVLKLREENKMNRVKFQEQLDKISKENEVKVAKIQEEAKSAGEAKKKLEALEAEQADKKRSLEEKLANREARIAETEAVLTQKLKEKEQEAEGYKAKALQYEAEQEARKQVYKDRIKEEMSSIPEEFKTFAERMVKGFEDPSEAWTALSEAKMKGMFGEKKIVVNHSVPGAADGARVNKAKAEAEEREAKKSKTSKDLIRSGLDKIINQKQTNSAFRTR